MKSRLRLFAYTAIFWICFFELSRILFLGYHFRLSHQLPVGDLVLILTHGIKMDISVTGYILMLLGLLLALTPYSATKVISNVLKYYTVIFLFVFTFLIVADMELYRHWGFRLDDTPLLYLGNPKEVMGSADPWLTLGLVVFWVVFFLTSYKIFRNKVLPSCELIKPGDWKISLVFLFITASLILPVRGSFGQSNMNIGFVYFHKTNTFANHAAINGIWNVKYYLLKSGKAQYDNNFFDQEKTKKYLKGLHSDNGETYKVLNTNRPNVIIIAIESYTSKIIEVLGGVEG